MLLFMLELSTESSSNQKSEEASNSTSISIIGHKLLTTSNKLQRKISQIDKKIPVLVIKYTQRKRFKWIITCPVQPSLPELVWTQQPLHQKVIQKQSLSWHLSTKKRKSMFTNKIKGRSNGNNMHNLPYLNHKCHEVATSFENKNQLYQISVPKQYQIGTSCGRWRSPQQILGNPIVFYLKG